MAREAARRRARPTAPAGGPDDRAVSDFVGTLLMVALVVALGGVVAVTVTSTLDEPAPSANSFSLMPAAAGDAQLRVLHRNGEPLPLAMLGVQVERDGVLVDVPRAVWSAPDPELWSPGQRLTLPISPPLAPEERVGVRIVRSDANVLAAQLTGRAAQTTLDASQATMVPLLSPNMLVADGLSSSLLTVRTSHPHGALAVSSLVADLSVISLGAEMGPLLVPLNDEGREGDALGGDGVWSAVIRLPSSSPLGMHAASLNLTDNAGRRTSQPFHVLVVDTPKESVTTWIGVTFDVPTSERITKFRLKDWVWDKLYPSRVRDDYVLLRIMDESKAWSCLIYLDEAGGVVYAKQMRVWGPTGETVYNPRNGTRLPLDGLDMDLMDPVASQQWVYSSGTPHPQALYKNAGLTGLPRFAATHFGQDLTTANQQLSLNTGIFSVETVVQ